MNKNYFIIGFVLLLCSSFIIATDFTQNNLIWVDVNEDNVSVQEYAGHYSFSNVGVSVINTDEMSFNGISDYLNYFDDGNFSFIKDGQDQAFTMSFWMNSNIWDSTTTPISKFAASGLREWKPYAPTSNKLRITLFSTTANAGIYSELNAVLNINQLYHVVMTYDGSETQTGVNIYVDGSAPTQTKTIYGGYTGMGNTAQDMYVGRERTTFYSGEMNSLSIWKGTELTSTQVTELYNLGETYNPYAEDPMFELKANNFYNGSSILRFNATISNSTTTQTISTTNGTIFWHFNDIINVTVVAEDYFDVVVLNQNTSNNLEVNMWQSELRVKAKDSVFNKDINVFNVTINDSTYTNSNNNTNEAFFRLNKGTYTYNVVTGNYTTASTGIFTLTGKEKQNSTVLFNKSTNNTLNFFDLRLGAVLVGANVSITYPSGYIVNLTTNAAGDVYFDLFNGSDYEGGNFKIVLEAFIGYITPITFNEEITVFNYPLNESYGISDASIRVNIFDRETGNLLTGTDVSVSLLTFGNKTTTNGTINFNDITLVVGDIIIEAIADGYIKEQQVVSYTGQENASINLYLLNATGDNTAFLFASVIDEFFRIQQEARVSLYEYDASTLSFIKISELDTNVNGEAVFGIELNVKTYYLIATKEIGGLNFSTQTNPEIIKTENEVRNLVLNLLDPYSISISNYLLITQSETFVNNVSTVFLSYITRDNFISEVCVGYFNMSNLGILLTEQCVNSSAAYLATPTLIDRDYDYEARIYQKYNGENLVQFVYPYKSINSFNSLLTKYDYAKPVFVWLI